MFLPAKKMGGHGPSAPPTPGGVGPEGAYLKNSTVTKNREQNLVRIRSVLKKIRVSSRNKNVFKLFHLIGFAGEPFHP